MKAFDSKLTKYELIERITMAKPLIESAYPEVVKTFEYQQLNRLFERDYPHGYEESKLFTKAQLVELVNGMLQKLGLQ